MPASDDSKIVPLLPRPRPLTQVWFLLGMFAAAGLTALPELLGHGLRNSGLMDLLSDGWDDPGVCLWRALMVLVAGLALLGAIRAHRRARRPPERLRWLDEPVITIRLRRRGRVMEYLLDE
jgi:hypothetical protein